MPLHGKIVVLKRSGGDGTEFPLTATCLFGRKPDCDIRIQIPQVSKEHCRIDLNENKEVILTNLSSMNPTCVNGQTLQQSERLKHGDVITIIDRSFRFESPPPPTPKKISSVGGKAEVAAADPHLKDGTNIDHTQRSLDKTQELDSKEDARLLESKSTSPFSDLYQMIKQSLDVKTPRKSSVSVLQTPSSKFCTPKPESARKKDATPKKAQTPVQIEHEQEGDGSLLVTPKSTKKRRSVQLSTKETSFDAQEAADTSHCNPTPQKFTLSEAVEHVATPFSKSPRKSKEKTPPASAKKLSASAAKTETTTKATPKSSEKEKSKKRKSEELGDLSTQEMKRKRVSFGGQLSPELFDKRLPPDSPLRKGATPRRSLCLYKPKQSLLRRASVIGLLKECDNERHLVESPKAKGAAKMKTPSPKKSPKGASPKTPTSAKKSPKAQSPKSKTPSPSKKATTSKSPKAQSPAQKVQSAKTATTPKKTPSPKTVKTTPAKSPARSKQETPENKPQRKSMSTNVETPKGKSASSTVSPVKSPGQTPKVQGRFSVSRINTPSPVAEDAVMAPSATATPKIPLKRKSMKSSAKKTPSLKSATKVMQRKSGMLRSSMKVMTSWADIVRFGKAKVQVGLPSKANVIKKTVKKKKTVPKPQTPKRKLVDHVSTGHAASPATIVVGRAHRQRVTHAAGAPPKIVTNMVVLQENVKMDEDLTGLSEMFKTPKNERRRSTKTVSKTPQTDLSKSLMDPSVLNTPEETGEMVVSPMSVASTMKSQSYNSEAVQRLLDGDASFISDISASDMQQETPQNVQNEVGSPKTPKQNPPVQEGLTGVRRMMKTPKQKAEPIDDLRGKILKTPKPKSEQKEFLSAVKRVLKTPKEKAAPVDDIRGKLLRTPKQKIQQQEECLTGVKRIMTTPKEKAQPVEDLCGTLLKTPKEKITQEECHSAVKAPMVTPDQKMEQQESVTEVKTTTPKTKAEQQEFLTGVKRVMKTPKQKYEPVDDIRGKLLQTPKQKIEQKECLTGVKRIMSTPKQKNEPVEDMVGVKRVMRTPKEKVPPVEKNFGIKRLMQSPRLRGNTPVEDFEGLEELMKEPVEEQIHGGTEEGVVIETIPQQVADELESESQKVVSTEEFIDQPESTFSICAEGTEIMASTGEIVQEESALEAKPVRGRRPKITEATVENKQDEIEAPVRARRGRKVDTSAPGKTAPSTSAKTPEEPTQEESVPITIKPRRGRTAKKPSKEQLEEDEAVATEAQAESEHIQPTTTTSDQVQAKAPEEPPVKQRRGRKKANEPCEAAEETVVMPTENMESSTESMSVKTLEEPVQEEIVPVTVKPRRGRTAKKPSKQQLEEDQAVATEPQAESEHIQPTTTSDQVQSTEPEEPPVKQRRGRKKANEPCEAAEETVVLPSESMSVKNLEEPVQEEIVPVTVKSRRGRTAKKPKEHLEEDQAVATESQAESEHIQPTTTSDQVQAKAPEEPPVKQRRGRKKANEPCDVKPCEAAEETDVMPAENLEDSTERHKPSRGKKSKVLDAEIPTAIEESKVLEEVASVKARRVKKTEAPAVVAVRGKRGRAGKTQENGGDIETISDLVDNQTCVLESTEEMAQEKPQRGRRVKARGETVLPEPGMTEVEAQHLEDPCDQPMPKAKPQRGRRAKAQTEQPQPDASTVEVCEAAEDVCVPQFEPSLKARKGRQAKSAAEPPEPEITTVQSEPVEEIHPEPTLPAEKPKRGKRTRTADDGHTTEVSQAPVQGKKTRTTKLEQEKIANSVPEPAAEELKAPEPSKKMRRTRKDDPSEEIPTAAVMETPVNAVPLKTDELDCEAPKSRRGAFTTKEVVTEEVSANSSTDKPKRGRKKQTSEIITEVEEVQQVLERDSAKVKPTRGRGKTAVQHDDSETISAKRARKAAVVSTEESTEMVVVPVEPVKRGRRAAKTPAEAKESTNGIEEKELSQRSVQWKADVEVFELTPRNTTRSRRTKAADATRREPKAAEVATKTVEVRRRAAKK